MRTFVRLMLVFSLVGLVAVACDDDDDDGVTPDPGPFTLTFEGDATFQGPHGNQELRVALIRTSDGTAVAQDEATVSPTADPAFSFTFTDVLESDESYRLAYWIDSNFNGGTAGVCESIDVDHQWELQISGVDEDLTLTETHDPSTRSDVCDDFSATLGFEGDASFQGAHGGQGIAVAILDGDGAVVGRAHGTVSADDDPSFSFSFPGLLLGGTYRAHYWIDSNFQGGGEGVCDAPDDDHQWDVSIGSLDGDLTHVEDHRAGETTSVCETFTADLGFAGDDTFGGAHGGQTITVGVVDEDGRLVDQATGTVSATADPSFSFSFSDVLVVGRSYTVDYWIDSNFQGGTEGVCDPSGDDHQWRVDLGEVMGDVSRTEDHDPGAQTDICATFD